MASPVASPESGDGCPRVVCPPGAGQVIGYLVFCIVTLLLTIIGACAHMVKPHANGLHLVVVGGSFKMDEPLPGNSVTIRFTVRADNPTGGNITYQNISATLAVLNASGENDGHFLRFPVNDFHVQKRTYVDSPTQVNATQLRIAENSIAVVLQFNGTMETSNRNSSAGYHCRIWTSKDDQACSSVKQHLV